jgi:peptidoglycan/LPS O-acetylase OafA/YrhL
MVIVSRSLRADLSCCPQIVGLVFHRDFPIRDRCLALRCLRRIFTRRTQVFIVKVPLNGAEGTPDPLYRPVSYQPALDGLRALAVASVLLYHDSLLIPGGFLGVDVFFVLSGFLITSLLVDEQRRTGAIDLRHFYLRRALRLFPALWALVAVGVVFALIFPRAPQSPHIWRGVVCSLIYVSNWVNAKDAFALGPYGHTWSLAVEEQFYLIWPLILIVLLRTTRRGRTLFRITLSLAALSALWRLALSLHGSSPWRLYNGSDTRADSLLMGCATAMAMMSARSLSSGSRRWLRWLAVGSVVFIGYLMATTSLEWIGYGRGMFSAVALATVTVLVALLTNSDWWLTRALSSRPFVWVGRLSYSLYLWHYPIYQFMKPERIRIDPRLVMVLRVCASVIAALGSFYLIERPFLRLKSRIGRRSVVGNPRALAKA